MERKKYLIYAFSAIALVGVGLGIARLITVSNTQTSGENNANDGGGNRIPAYQENSEENSSGASSPAIDETIATEVNTPDQLYSYKNGTYSVTVDYSTPDGIEKIGVSLTVQDNMVVGSQFTDLAKDRKSQQYNRLFAQNYVSQVNGKPLDSIMLSNVFGASLTTQAFNKAVDQIRMQARN